MVNWVTSNLKRIVLMYSKLKMITSKRFPGGFKGPKNSMLLNVVRATPLHWIRQEGFMAGVIWSTLEILLTKSCNLQSST